MKHTHRLLIRNISMLFCLVNILTSTVHAGNRTHHRFGIHLSFLGDPFPTLLGGNLNFNLADWMRITAGYGSVSASTIDATTLTTTTISATTLGGGLRFFVPNWGFSPVLGFSMANVTISGAGAVGGFSGSANHFYVTGGFDWQAGVGFNLGFGYNYSLLEGVGGLPYVNLGWYF